MADRPFDWRLALLAWLIVCVFVDGVAIGYMIDRPELLHFVLACLILTCGIAFTTVTAALPLFRLLPSSKRMAALTSEIHGEVRYLVEDGYTKLLPQDTDRQTIYLLIKMEGNIAIIDCIDWDEFNLITGHVSIRRRYMIESNGQLTRRVIGRNWQCRDRNWRDEPLTQHKLEHLLYVLRCHYSPRYALAL